MQTTLRNMLFATCLGLATFGASAQADVASAVAKARKEAVIKSAVDLARYQEITPASNSPFSRLSPGALTDFTAELRFGDAGLTGFSYAALLGGPTATEIHQILALFGAQNTTKAISGARVVTGLDRRIMDGMFFVGRAQIRGKTPSRLGTPATASLINGEDDEFGPIDDPWGPFFDWGPMLDLGDPYFAGVDYKGYFCSQRRTCTRAENAICLDGC